MISAVEWFCPGCAEDSTRDCKRDYQLGLLWALAYDQAQQSAVKAGNGALVVSGWLLDMIGFWNNNHYKYLILGHALAGGRYYTSYQIQIKNHI